MSDDQAVRILEAIGALRSELLASMRSEIAGLRSELRAEIAGLRSELRSEMEALGSALRSEMATLSSRMSALEAKLGAVRADVMARIDRLQNELTAEREGDIVTFGAAERAEKIAKATREEISGLGSQVTALARLVKMVQSRLDHLEGRDGLLPRPQ